MIFFSLLLFLLLLLTAGWLLLLLWPATDRQPALALSFLLGGGLISWQLFIVKFIFQLSLGTWCLGLVLLEIVCLAYYHHRRGQPLLPSFKLAPVSGHLNYLLLGLIGLVLTFALFKVATNPLISFDALAVWAYRVKILYYHQADLFNPNSLVFWSALPKSNYPWHLSFLAWFQAQLSGGVSETWLNLLPWCYYALLLQTLYFLAKDKLSQTWSLALVVLVATMPLIFYHSYNFYADLPLATYLALILLVWRRWLLNKQASTLLLLTVLAGLSLTLKSEAIFFIAFLCGLSTLKIWRDKVILKNIWLLISTVILALPWFTWLFYHGLGVSNVSSGLAWHPEVGAKILSILFVAASWHLWWYLVLLIIIVTWTSNWREVSFRYNLAWFIFSLLSFLTLYFFTETYQYVLDDTAVSRNFILFIPLSFALVVDCLATFFKQD